MRHHGGQQIDLVAMPGSCRYIRHLILRFEFGENPFLATTTIVESHYPGGGQRLIGQDDLECITVLVGDEQVQLYGLLVLIRLNWRTKINR